MSRIFGFVGKEKRPEPVWAVLQSLDNILAVAQRTDGAYWRLLRKTAR